MADYTKIDGVAAASIVKVVGVAAASITKVTGVTKPSGDYDWASSLFDEDTITDGTNWIDDAASVDHFDGGGSYPRRANSYPYKNTAFPFVDTSGASPALKLVHVGHAGDGNDDFNECATGSQLDVATGQTVNNTLACVTSTGIEFSGGDMVDGDHVIKWQFKHDAKSDTYYSITAVLSCASNVLTAYVIWRNNGASYQDYYDAATAKDAAYQVWQITWDNSTNTWTIDDEDGMWEGANTGAASMSTSGGTVTKNGPYDIVGSATDDKMWEITVG